MDRFNNSHDWQKFGLCREADRDMFFADKGDHHIVAAAKAICNMCIVRVPCLDYAIANRETIGVWGGMSPGELRRERIARSHLSAVPDLD